MQPWNYIIRRTLPTLFILGMGLPSQAQLNTPPEETAEVEPQQETPESSEKMPYTFNDVASCIVIIESETCLGGMSGSGFIAKVDGKTYIYTNQHVVMGADTVEFVTASGEKLSVKSIELSMERDIARFLIDDREEALVISDNVAMNIPLAVFGNSEGGGVATELYGEVTGVGSDLVEVSAEFVSGNSGSPVLNADKEVIGIASYVRYSAPSKENEDAEEEDKVRRFCYRLTGVEFVPINWRSYNERYGKPYLVTQSSMESMMGIIQGWGDEPFGRVPTENLPDISLNSWSHKHNKMVERVDEVIRRNRASRSTLNKIRDEIKQSAHDLATVSYRLSTELGKKAEERALTGFLRKEFESYASGLEYISELLEEAGQDIADWIDSL